ncbi:MAG TPA: transketolase C-terminal domain-containing protein [Candidatus Kapabacteria bacterium]|nr:transketolase C-terminal domain-containing protein [Candidatus Kapabacteria bacterium]
MASKRSSGPAKSGRNRTQKSDASNGGATSAATNGAAAKAAAANGTAQPKPASAAPGVDWQQVARLMLLSRAIDQIEEERLVPGGLVTYQFSSRGHDLAQILLALAMRHPHDAATVYYRSRPFVLAQGLTALEAIRSTMGRAGGISEGRDIGVVHNMPSRGGAHVLPTSGDVGAQYTPAIGWAQAARYRSRTLGQTEWDGAIAAALGGDGSTATNGFWAALNIATVGELPFLFFIEDNGYGISVPCAFQTPGANFSDNLQSFKGLRIIAGSGTEPLETARLIDDAVTSLRSGGGPVLLHLKVPRLAGHSFVDTQAYKSAELLESERADDPLPKLRAFMIGEGLTTERDWLIMEAEAHREAEAAAEESIATGDPDTARTLDDVFYQGNPQEVGGLLPELGEDELARRNAGRAEVEASGPRMNFLDAVRRTLAVEMERNDRMLLFGEDVGAKGGVHGATIDMQIRFGAERVFDTSLNEEGIIGRAVGMAMAGLTPVPEIQFRKYADPAHEQISDCGTIRWRTAGKFAAPMVVRIPVGFGKKSGDPWHSVSGEAIYAHLVGWRVIIPSNAEDAVGLLRTALRGNDPCFFFEHRALLDTREGRRPYPGDEYMIPLGVANIVRSGTDLTIVTWGEMVHRALEAAEASSRSVEVIDLRTVSPWDKQTVLASVRRTNRCIVVHEDNWTCGFGAEIASTITQEAFRDLDAPVERVATPDIPIPYNPTLMNAVVPTVESIGAAIERVGRF